MAWSRRRLLANAGRIGLAMPAWPALAGPSPEAADAAILPLDSFEPGAGDLPSPRSAGFDPERPFLFDGLTPRYATRVVRSGFIPMRDGVRLSTDFHVPLGARLPLPVVLSRTPYDKRATRGALHHILPEQGFIFAVQDVRGRHESEGRFLANTGQDREDGYDTVSWLARQPWCNGRVGAIGSSYVGETAAKLAAMRHPNHAASIIMFDGAYAADTAYNGAFCQAGVAMLRSLFEWFRDGVPKVSYGPPPGIDRQAWFRSPASQVYRTQPVKQPDVEMGSALAALPVADALDRTGAAPSEFAAMMRANADPGSAYWRAQGFLTEADRIDTPTLHLTGNEDQGGSGARLFRLFRERAASARAREHQHLLFAAAPHSGHARASERTVRGLRDFGDTRFPYYRTFVDWFGHWLRDDDGGVERWPKARFYVTGRNRWDSSDQYPPPDARPVKLFLHPGKGRRGGLSTRLPGAAPASARFRYDPANPTPSDLPGAAAELIGVGFGDRAPLEARDDLLVFTSEPLARPLEIAGGIEAVLSISSNAPDTDFVAVLVEVDAAGRAINVTHGVQRMRWREGFARAAPLVPGQVYRASIDLWFANIRFAKGNRLRLHVGSSYFPFFDRNLNTGDDNYTTTAMRTADNVVHLDRANPSYLVLPARGRRVAI